MSKKVQKKRLLFEIECKGTTFFSTDQMWFCTTKSAGINLPKIQRVTNNQLIFYRLHTLSTPKLLKLITQNVFVPHFFVSQETP